MDILSRILQLIVSLSILVVVHEWGHYIAAKIFKTRVEKFYLFFNPWFSLFKYQRGETEFGIGWLPLGGYVKISGMIDESMDKEQMKLPAQPWEFRSKPAWQRLIIMLGGIIMNVILGWVIYSMVLFTWGQKYVPLQNMKYGIACDSIATEVGLKDGDMILKVGDVVPQTIDEVPMNIVINQAKSITVNRDGQNVVLPVGVETVKKLIVNHNGYFIAPRIPYIIDSFPAFSVAQKVGLKKDDQVIAVNNIATPFMHQVRKELLAHKNSITSISILRMNDTVNQKVWVDSVGRLSVYAKLEGQLFDTYEKHYGFFESFPEGAKTAAEKIELYVKQFRIIFSGEYQGYKYLGGFISIAQGFSTSFDWLGFWSFTAFLSLVLAFMNLLPIPALDGGHVLFTLYEMITRRKPNEKFLEYAQIAGMVLLIALLAFANGNDIFRHLFNK